MVFHFNRHIFIIPILLFLSGTPFAEELSLPVGLRLAMGSNRLIKMSAEDIEISRAEASYARSPMLPEVRLSAAQTYLAYQPEVLFGMGSAPMSEKDFISYGLSVQQVLYDFGGNRTRYEASKLGAEVKRLDSLKTKNLVALEFTLSYLDLLESERMLAVLEKEVERLTGHMKNAEKLYAEGVITKNELLQAGVKLADGRQRELTGKNLRQINAARINAMLSRPLDTDVAPVELPEISPISESPVTDAIEARPEVKALEISTDALGLRQESKRAEYFPRFFVKGGYDFTENRYQLHEGNWSLTVGMGLNLFSGGATKAETAKIERQRLLANEQRAKLLDEIGFQIKAGMLNLESARKRLEIARGALGQAEENLRISRSRYESGTGTGTDVLDAVSLLAVSEANCHKALYDLKRAEAAVLYATGKDFLEVYK